MKKKQILFVEDERLIAEDIKMRLQKLGYAVPGIVFSGEEAVKKAESMQPDLVLMDIVLEKKMNGIEAASIISSRFNIPIVYLTAYADNKTLEKAKATEPFGYILKLFEDRELRTTIEMALYKFKMGNMLKESEERYRGVVENAHDAIYIINQDGFQYANPAFEKLAGWKNEELCNKEFSFWDIVHPDDKNLIKEKKEAWKKGKQVPNSHEFRIISKDGGERAVEANTINIGKDGEVQEIGILRDITERKRAEEELEKHRAHLKELVKERTNELEKKSVELEQANIQLQEADRLKSVFLANMSHELRTPLNSIIGFTGIILQGLVGKINKEQRKQLTVVKNSAEHLLGLINDILDISKIEAGKVELIPEEFGINDVVGDVVETLSPRASEKGLEILTDVPEFNKFFTDKKRLKQVLLNFVSNAVKFTDHGSIKITAKILNDKKLEMRVIDTGIGIKKEDMNKLFAPFQQVDMSPAKSYEGTGLGLHLSRRLSNLLKGNISAKSKYGSGSEFILIIPLKFEEGR